MKQKGKKELVLLIVLVVVLVAFNLVTVQFTLSEGNNQNINTLALRKASRNDQKQDNMQGSFLSISKDTAGRDYEGINLANDDPDDFGDERKHERTLNTEREPNTASEYMPSELEQSPEQQTTQEENTGEDDEAGSVEGRTLDFNIGIGIG